MKDRIFATTFIYFLLVVNNLCPDRMTHLLIGLFIAIAIVEFTNSIAVNIATKVKNWFKSKI